MPAKKTPKKKAAKAAKKSAAKVAKKSAKKAPKKSAKKSAARKITTVRSGTDGGVAQVAAPDRGAIEREAFFIYQQRCELGLPGSPEGDWAEAVRRLGA
jgi:hypothetical protein